LFSRSAQAEAEVKSFGVSKAHAIRIHEQLQLKVERTIVSSGLPLIKSTEATQQGETFGERLANAVTDCLAQGFEKLIVVGGDAPELTATDIAGAHSALKQGRPTLGKDFKGGSFLIGLLKDSFRQKQFAELPWQTKHIACALQTELGLHCKDPASEVYVLSARADCNSQQDLYSFAKRAVSEVWSILLNSCVRRMPILDTDLELVSCFGESPTLRGPPAELSLAA